MDRKLVVFAASFLISTMTALPALARQTSPSGGKPQKADVGAIKEKYWAKGEESELGVVQNRLYSKSGRVELGVFTGFLSSDPFLDTNQFGASIGYHLSELWAIHAFGWKSFTRNSKAFSDFEIASNGGTVDTNRPESFYGAEVGFSPIYGKLSLMGSSIVYYDFHLLAGAGLTGTETGTYATPFAGLGQQFWISDAMSLRIDYRLMGYNETIKDKETSIPGRYGTVVDERWNWTHSLTLGVTFLIGG